MIFSNSPLLCNKREVVLSIRYSNSLVVQSVHETIIQVIQQVGRTEYPVNAYFAAQLQELVERSAIDYSLDDVLNKIIEHHNRMKQIEPAKCDSSSDKQSDSKEVMKKSEKAAAANLAVQDGDLYVRSAEVPIWRQLVQSLSQTSIWLL